MGLGFSKSEDSAKQNLGHMEEIQQILKDSEIEKNAKEVATLVGEEARKAAYNTAYQLSKERAKLAKADIDKKLNELESETSRLKEMLKDKDDELQIKHDEVVTLTQLVCTLQNQLEERKKKDDELAENKKKLEQIRSTLEFEKKEILGIGAPSYQARKLYGDAMPGDITHEDVLKHFSEFFKYYIRNLPKQNPFISADDVKECITPCFQICFEISCQYALQVVKEQASILFNDPSTLTEEMLTSFRIKEEQIDTSQAYSLLLYHANVKERKEQIIKNLVEKMDPVLTEKVKDKGISLPKNFVSNAAKITWEMVTLIPPALSCTPWKYNKYLHEQRNSYWKVKDEPFKLVYYRPVLFFGNDGHVGLLGQVGNKECDDSNFDNDIKTSDMFSTTDFTPVSSGGTTSEFEIAKTVVQQVLVAAISRVQLTTNRKNV